jgi:hypothetical protein
MSRKKRDLDEDSFLTKNEATNNLLDTSEGLSELIQKISEKSLKNPSGRLKTREMKKYNICLTENDYKLLQQHFESLGLSTSGGIRMALKIYMKKEGIE